MCVYLLNLALFSSFNLAAQHKVHDFVCNIVYRKKKKNLSNRIFCKRQKCLVLSGLQKLQNRFFFFNVFFLIDEELRHSDISNFKIICILPHSNSFSSCRYKPLRKKSQKRCRTEHKISNTKTSEAQNKEASVPLLMKKIKIKNYMRNERMYTQRTSGPIVVTR